MPIDIAIDHNPECGTSRHALATIRTVSIVKRMCGACEVGAT